MTQDESALHRRGSNMTDIEKVVEVAFAGLDDRLDRLLVTDSDGRRFVLSGVSAHNITEISKEWLRKTLPIAISDEIERLQGIIENMREIRTTRALSAGK